MSITIFLILIILLLAVAVGVLFFFLIKTLKTKDDEQNKKEDNSFLLIQNQLNALTEILDKKIGESSKMMQDSVKTQFGESQKLIKNVTEELASIKETNKQVFSMTEQLQNLEKVLKSQKQRGNLGEAGLELILSNVLPPTAYKMQYAFKDGDIVDAIIETKDGIIPVDAKFSLENYNRVINEDDENRKAELEREFKNDLKKRIDETSKYIKPKEGTLPFAIMYIPAEAIYYDLLVNEVGSVNARDLIDYAYINRKVIIVSPTTFVAYLSTILQGFKAFKIEESAKTIIKNVEKLQTHLKAYDSFHTKLGNSLATTVNHWNTSRKELKKVDKDVARITGESSEVEPLVLDKPNKEE